MPGLFGVVDLKRRDTGGRLPALAEEMAKRLTGARHDAALICEGRLVLGRAGAAHHHSEAWRSKAGPLAVAGILHLTSQNAEEAARRGDFAALRGFFAALVQDAAGGLAILADRRASVPVFYAQHDGLLLFAPEVKALLAARDLPRDADDAALASFLSSGHLLGAQTLFRSVRRLRGGEAIRIAPDGALAIERYWRFSPGLRAGLAREGELADARLEKIEAAVARNLTEPRRSFVFLSGGSDSRGVFCAALQALAPEQITAVTWTRDQGGGRSDLDIASRVAAAAGVRHVVVTSRPLGFAEHFPRSNALIDGLTDSAPAHPYFALIGEELAANGLLTGLRGDEVFGWWHPVASFAEALAAVGLRSIDQVALGRAIRPERLDGIGQAQREALGALRLEVDGLTPQQAKDRLYFEHRLQTYLGTQNRLLTASIDQRNPLLDEVLMDFMELVPDPLRAHKLLYQRALARRYASFWRLGLAGRSARPDWATLMSLDPQILTYLGDALGDGGSGIWDHLSREHMRALLEQMTRYKAPSRSGWRSVALSMVRRVRPMLPRRMSSLVRGSQSSARPVGPALQLWRMVALKHWWDVLRVA